MRGTRRTPSRARLFTATRRRAARWLGLALGLTMLTGVAVLSARADVIVDYDEPRPPVPPPPPESPSRADVMSALGGCANDVRSCVSGSAGGQLTVRVEFESSGRVRGADVTSSLSAAVENCVVLAVSKARVPPFRQAIFRVNFPYRY